MNLANTLDLKGRAYCQNGILRTQTLRLPLSRTLFHKLGRITHRQQRVLGVLRRFRILAIQPLSCKTVSSVGKTASLVQTFPAQVP